MFEVSLNSQLMLKYQSNIMYILYFVYNYTLFVSLRLYINLEKDNSQILEIVQKENRLYVQVLYYISVYHTYREKFGTLMRAKKLCLIDGINCKMLHNCKACHIIKNVSIYK